jgi:alanine racemase
MVRVGILLYGVYPSSSLAKTIDVRPALLWKSQVVFFKVVLPHRPVGYGSTWQSNQMTRVVTIPVGYGDGYHRHMMGQAEVLIRGKRYPVIGSICMDQIMVNIGWDEVYNGEEVVLLGPQGKEEITAHELALWSGSISYEMLTSINLRVSRVYI